MENISEPSWIFCNFKTVEYTHILAKQHSFVEKLSICKKNLFIVLWGQHPRVFTLGKRNNKDDCKLFLKKNSIPVVQTQRGGLITFHGPGQLIAYPLLQIERLHIGINELVTRLEEVMIRTAADFKLCAKRHLKHRGVWVNNRKLGSVGLAIRHGISFHGFALNVNVDLEPFRWITPCGIKNVQMTSLEIETEQLLTFEHVMKQAQSHFQTVFGINAKMLDMDKLFKSDTSNYNNI